MNEREKELQSWFRTTCPLFDHIGLVVESASDGVFRCTVPLTPENSNHFDTVHAAIQWASAEVLGGLVVMSIVPLERRTQTFAAVRSVNIEFLRPARTSIVAETRFDPAESVAIRAALDEGRNSEFSLESTVRDATGEPVAIAQARYVLRPWRQSATA
ncbi:PaaI family thioesterase [Sinimarinibacterium sp. CAU 1509]|uniref:PaaI family thioesterase n=1 Tax=Sinimarinibacterium sp. CAU 1509 TaxID=2562283 RepID=UPI00146E2B4F|nr:PaaI family thioesterase [Sinimarinibacterium sp. CAU 1509]